LFDLVIFGITFSLAIIALALVLSTVPVWMAAKVVGAGQPEFPRVLAALVIGTVVSGVLVSVAGVFWGLLLVPVVFVVTFSRFLDTSYLGAFMLCVLAVSFQAIISKVLG